ncbi:extracellular solute-binding protein [Streptomyces armeniacus]|uniref:Extracellular solute-binding protein n=1 Tax=Streptomyces armeniacus TaxID=83291 RepID=A0A345XUQ1_9ACTN|nr:extracellular solute-binding protein [Streptomyces armeniacus]AXK35367.1 extracellular solute-binding protein [Streptomyces armeniacus]
MKPGARSLTALALALAASGTACGGDGDGGDPGAVSGEITWWDTSNATEAPVFARLVADFERKYPDVEVKHVNVPFTEARGRYEAAARTGRGVPDVLRADVGWTAGLVEQGYLADLTDTPALHERGDFLPSTAAGTALEGGVYGVPQVTDTLALFYNRRLLERAGADRPPATWRQLKATAADVAAATGADGIALNTDPYFALPFLYGEKGGMVDSGSRTITVAGAASVRGATTAAELVRSGAAPRPPAGGKAYDAMQEAFKNGDVAMMVNGPWATADALSGREFADPENLGVAPVPAGSTGRAGAPVGGHNLVVSKHAGNSGDSADGGDSGDEKADSADAARHFVRFMTDARQQERAAVRLGLLPTRKSAYTRKVLADPVRSAFYTALTKAVPREPLAQGQALFDELEPAWEAVLRRTESPRPALTGTAERWRAELLYGYRIAR